MFSVRRKGEPVRYSLLPHCNVPEGFFVENSSYELVLLSEFESDRWDIEVSCNGVPLEQLARKDEHFFILDLDYYAGELRLVVQHAGKILFQKDIVVDPAKAKLTRSQYVAMLKDIANDTLSLYRLSQTTVKSKTHRKGKQLNIATLELIRVYFDQLLKSVQRITRTPVKRLDRISKMIRADKARRIDGRSIQKAVLGRGLRPATAVERTMLPSVTKRLAGHWVDSISVGSCKETNDIYENRVIYGFLIWLDSTVRIFLSNIESQLNDQPVSVLQAWKHRLKRYQLRLRQVLKLSFFHELKPIHGEVRPTSVFLNHPEYGTVFRLIRYIKSGVDCNEGDATMLPIDRTYRLYEMWCYIRLVRALCEKSPEIATQLPELLREIPEEKGEFGTKVLQGAGASLMIGKTARLIYQREYNPTSYNKAGAGTVAISARPDFVLETCTQDNKIIDNIFVIDPKYRVGPALYDAVRALHVYRDAIIGDDGKRLVLSAIIISPYQSATTSDATGTNWERAALPEKMFFADFRDKYKLGAISARPEQGSNVFQELADELLSLAKN